jgi:hypothetical protein
MQAHCISPEVDDKVWMVGKNEFVRLTEKNSSVVDVKTTELSLTATAVSRQQQWR